MVLQQPTGREQGHIVLPGHPARAHVGPEVNSHSKGLLGFPYLNQSLPTGQEQGHVALPGNPARAHVGPEVDDSCLRNHPAPADGDTTKPKRKK